MGEVAGEPILNSTDKLERGDIDTVTLYVNPAIQEQYKSEIERLQPKRVIFNPGTENVEWMEELKNQGIESEIACTLVLLATGQY